MTPPKQGISANIGKNFAQMLQFEDLAVKYFFNFQYVHIFMKQILNWHKCISYECQKNKTTKTFYGKKFQCVQRGPFQYFKHTIPIFPQLKKKNSSTFITNAFDNNSRFFFHKNMHVIKKKEMFHRNFFPNVGGNSLF